MLMECNMLSILKRPAVCVALGALQTVSATDIPVGFRFVSFKDNMCNRKIVSVIHCHSFPLAKQNVQVLRNFHSAINHLIYKTVSLGKHKNITMRIFLYRLYHINKIFIARDITRNMEAEKPRCAKCIINFLPVLARIVIENFQIAVVGFLYILIKAAHFSRIAFFSASTMFRTGHDWRKRNGLNLTHFSVALGNSNLHDVYPFSFSVLFDYMNSIAYIN